MDQHYDVIVLGTGLTECVLSGLLSMEGKKVLHLDRNEYYGGECASLSLSKLFEKFGRETRLEDYGRDRDYNIDLVPKFLLVAGELVQILVHTDVTRYLEFQQIAGSFVYREGSGICKVPSTEMEAVTSPLMGFFEKRRAKGFFHYVQGVDPDNPKTWAPHDLRTISMSQLYGHYGLEAGTQDFIGHSLALHLDESYLTRPALETCQRIQLYMRSMLRFGKSPYVYPRYGLGELPQAFARLSAIYGGTYMLGTPVDELLFDDAGKIRGIKTHDGQMATCDAIICDPSYARDRVLRRHQVVRAICLLDHPIPNTNNADSCQIIIPQRQLRRQYDVYIAAVSSAHQVCAPGHWVAMVSTILENSSSTLVNEAVAEREIAFALSLLGPIKEKFIWLTDMLEPLEDGRESHLFIARSYDATSHFETVCEDVKDLYLRYAGKPLEVKKRPSAEEEQESMSRSTSVGGINDV